MANSKGQWRRLRVVVELPVRGNLSSEKRLARAVAEALDRCQGSLHRIDGQIGALRVLEYNRVFAADQRRAKTTMSRPDTRDFLVRLEDLERQMDRLKARARRPHV